MKSKYQQGNLSLVHIDCLPQNAQAGKPSTSMVLAHDVEGKEYTLTCMSEKTPEREMPVLHTFERAMYVEVKVPIALEYQGNLPVLVEPGTYKVRKESDYIYKHHGSEVAKYALLIGRALGFDEAHLKELEFAGNMHDIGLTGLEETLWKAQWFKDEDWAIVKGHPKRGADLVEKLKGKTPYATDRAKEYVLHHHAHFDGSGYPESIAGEEIPIGARIILIADAFHAMISWRPFRQPLPEHTALDRLFADAGYRYDEKLLAVFAKELEEQAITALAS